MKNSKKLLAFVLAFAMVMSVMVVPVGAADVPTAPQNLLPGQGYNASFENIETARGYGVQPAALENEIVTPAGNMIAAVDGSSYLWLKNRTANTDRVEFKNLGLYGNKKQLEVGKTYEVSCYIATLPDSEGNRTEAQAKVEAVSANTADNTVMVGTLTGTANVTINSDEFTKITCYATIADNDKATADTLIYKGINVQTWTTKNYDVYVDNFCVKEVVPEMTVSVTGVTEGAEVDPREDLTLTYTFSNAPYVFAPANVVVTPAGADVTVAGSDNEYTVTLSNLATNANYTVALTGVQDMYAQAAESTISFATNGPTIFQNLLPDMGFNAGFEVGSTGSYRVYPTTLANEIVTPTTGMIPAVEGSSYLWLKNRTANTDRVEFHNIGMQKSVQLESKKTYEISCYMATLPDGEGNATSATAKVAVDPQNAGDNTITTSTGASVSGANVAINSNEFTKVSCIVTIEDNVITGMNKGVKIYTWATAGYDVYVDNFSVKEVAPELTVSVTGVTDGGELDATSATLTYTFSNAPYDFKAKNVVVTPAGADVAVSGSDTVYTVALSNLRKGVEYNVALTGVQDMYAQAVASELSFTTTSYYLQSANIASGVTPAATTGSIDTVDGVTTLTKTTAGSARWNVPYVLGKRYILTASVKSNVESPNQWANVEIRPEDYISSRHYYAPTKAYTAPSVYLSDNDWHELYNVAEINDPVACDCTTDTCTKNSSTAGAYVSVYTSGLTTSLSIKDLAVRELKALDVDGTCFATVVRNGDTARLYLEAPGKTKIYFAAVSMVGGKAADIQFVAADLTEGFPVAALDLAIGDTYKIMVWDGNFAPLCNAFLGAYI